MGVRVRVRGRVRVRVRVRGRVRARVRARVGLGLWGRVRVGVRHLDEELLVPARQPLLLRTRGAPLAGARTSASEMGASHRARDGPMP